MGNENETQTEVDEFNPNEVEKSEDDGTSRTEGLDAEDKVVEK